MNLKNSISSSILKNKTSQAVSPCRNSKIMQFLVPQLLKLWVQNFGHHLCFHGSLPSRDEGRSPRAACTQHRCSLGLRGRHVITADPGWRTTVGRFQFPSLMAWIETVWKQNSHRGFRVKSDFLMWRRAGCSCVMTQSWAAGRWRCLHRVNFHEAPWNHVRSDPLGQKKKKTWMLHQSLPEGLECFPLWKAASSSEKQHLA